MSQPVLAISRRTRSTPYSNRVSECGVKGYTVYNRTLLSTQFRESAEADYWHLREFVQIWDVTCERQVQLQGPDAAKLAQLMTPRNLQKAVVGQGVYAPIVNQDGGMLNDPIILKLAEDKFWLSIADSDLLLWAKGLAYGMNLNVDVTEPDVFPLAVQGPKADDVVAKVFGEQVRDIRFFRFEELEFQGVKMPVARSGWSKQGGFEIYLTDFSLGEALWDALWDAGKEFNIGPGNPNLIERIEGGLFSYGNDFTTENNPLECGLDQYCHLDGGFDFIGKEALLKIREEGVKRRIRGLVIDGELKTACSGLWPVEVDGKFAGNVTSACYSPALKNNIANGMIEIDFCETGQSVTVQTPDGPRQAKICDLPFEVPEL
ncbi:dimethylsulfoniopropionate demethylase [Curvivirga aplysinae]|uniref:dimethylsulfoniopropionate demethylase n=1 Tax=Curvivirga aplysinae TaxID=2529852 RepID=UPI0012BD61F1|nr:dimethylsulfoniopropionate demethylase [Curvivirga aplysinae]MTI09369.1 dimethylsulfoniopropionate demethylase [Curvivirga aplysinae]